MQALDGETVSKIRSDRRSRKGPNDDELNGEGKDVLAAYRPEDQLADDPGTIIQRLTPTVE